MSAPITPRQVGKLQATFAGLGVTDRAQRLDVLSGVVYRPIGSTKDLTFAEASVAINLLDGVGRGDERLTRLAEHGAQLRAVTA